MKVTDLRVTGFKSFVDPVHLKIEPGLTGIVGPNGCGKSNILESLRWVMGATSARALRGGEMDDVIFAGTDKRPARDIAEVLITLDNREGRAPAPFNLDPILEVSRRLRRAAGSTFKINGKEVRARDVQLLFADASTGANSPALVRQNQVSELINAKPENRRRILEEAAGISGLYTRRHEAELKLRSAQANLERLDDVIQAMQDQLTSLRRQSRQAEKYRAIAEEIRTLESFLFAQRLRESQTAFEEAQATQFTAEQELADATLRANEAAQAAENSDHNIHQLREEQAIAEAVLRRLDGQNIACERDLQVAKEALRLAKSDIERIDADKSREQALFEDAKQNIAQTQETLAQLPDPSALEQAIHAAQRVATEASTQFEAAQLALTETISQRAQAVAERTAQIKACEDAKGQEQRRLAALALAQEELDRQNRALPDTGQLTIARHEAQAIAQAAQDAGAQADQSEKEAEAGGVIENERRETARLAQNQLDLVLAEIKALNATAPKSMTQSWAKVLHDVRPKAGYERAVAAAFGDELQAALDPKAPAAWLGQTVRSFNWPAPIRPLDEGIEAIPEALRARLQATGLVDDISFEEDLNLPTGGRVVTMAGDMRRWDGFVRRKDAVASAAGELEQRTRLEALQRQLPTLQEQAQAAAKAAAEAHAQADHLRALARQARVEAPRAYAAVSQARERVTRLEAELARAMAGVEQAQARCSAARIELEQAQMLRTVAEELLAALPQEGESHDVDAVQHQELAARAKVNQANHDLNQLLAQNQARSSLEQNLKRDLQSWTSRLAAAQDRLTALDNAKAQALAREEAAARTPFEVEKRQAELLRQLPAAQARKSKADDALAQSEATIKSLRELDRQAQNALSICREARAAAVIRTETAIERLKELGDEIRRTLQIDPNECEKRARAAMGDMFETIGIDATEARLAKLHYDRDALGGVNLRADEEAQEQDARMSALIADKQDLTSAIAKLRDGVDQINLEGKERLATAFEAVQSHFQVLFEALFDGGTAHLSLTQSDDPLGGGLEVYACPPGKKLQSLTLMSGGEQALTASALIFAVFLSNPAPICVLDEVDAPLDDSNVDRYCRLLEEMRQRTQTRFIVITHHPITMARMDRLFGVTMAERGVSQLVSVDLRRAEALIGAQ
ncbi:chromosome segregation SMC family protein [Candidatus Phycosocius spiralis]|uniref:Chromosome partition protein Smc n=1 Tax=Candidatus Phycosocius spiralis TaxID=2815099 RepID=A0ABQ4PXD1_9PROT|nr:AAA family ATPase [Candidatus Phycosocius spiralis]GIU67329.1 chromosome partition protein Smc [Candidatus Phycosocius spiralis]